MKKYLKELKTNPYWEVEPHFFYWSMWETIRILKTISKNKMTPEDSRSALYGEFVVRGKPIPEGFIKNFNSMFKFLDKILTRTYSKADTNNS